MKNGKRTPFNHHSNCGSISASAPLMDHSLLIPIEVTTILNFINFLRFFYKFVSLFSCLGPLFSLPCSVERQLLASWEASLYEVYQQAPLTSGFQLLLVNREIRGSRMRQDISLAWLLPDRHSTRASWAGFITNFICQG